MENNVEMKRDISFDIAKGIAIFLVVWGHVLQQGIGSSVENHPIFRIIYSVHMPLFAVISGYFFFISAKKRSLRELVIPKVKSYLKLIVIWNSVHYIFELVLHRREQFSIGTFIREWFNEFVYGYWFLWAMLFYSCLSAVVIKKFKEQYWFMGFIGVMAVCMISPCRWVIITLYPFFVLGLFVAHKDGLCFIRQKRSICVAGLIYGIGMVVYLAIDYITNSQIKVVLDAFLQSLRGDTSYVTVSYEFGRLMMYYFIGIAGSICIIGLSKWLAEQFVHCRITRILSLLGGESLAIYILQRIVVEQVCPGLYSNIVEKYSLVRYNLTSDIVGGIISFGVSCIFVLVIFWMIKGLKRFSVGRFVVSNK